MTRFEVIRSIRELSDLAEQFAGDKAELLNIAARMRNRVNQLEAHAVAGRPDLVARLRETRTGTSTR